MRKTTRNQVLNCVSEDIRCKTPPGLSLDYSKPQNQHWTKPCNLDGGEEVDTPCNVYLDNHMCQDKTVCTLNPT